MSVSRMDRWIRETEGLEALTRDLLETLQLKKLNALLAREKERDGFYRNLPDHLPSLSALADLPFTYPSDLMEKPGGFLLTSQAEIMRIISGQTSGTAGPAKRIFYTERDLLHTVGLFEAGIGEMAEPGDKVLIAMPFSGPFGLGDLIEKAVAGVGAEPVRSVAFDRTAGPLNEAAGSCDRLPAEPTGMEPSEEDLSDQEKHFAAQIGQIRREKPTCVIGFPVPILGLTRLFTGGGGPGSFPIKKALISGDACPEGVTRALEARGLELFPHYGLREMALGGAITCQAHEGMHLRENHVLAEIIGADGRPVPDGVWGELVITTLDMEAMPLIRYRTGDRTRFLPGMCPCGGVTRRLDRVSRMGVAGREVSSMEEIDNTLFPLPGVIDVKAERDGDTLIVTVLGLPEFEQARAEEALGARFPRTSVRVECEEVKPDTRPYYEGKRVIAKRVAGTCT